MIFESMAVQPLFCYLTVFIGATGKKEYLMTLVVPVIEDFKCIRIGFNSSHSAGLLIRHIVADSSVNVNQIILYMRREFRAQATAASIVGVLQKRCSFGVFAHGETVLLWACSAFSKIGDVPGDDFAANNSYTDINAEICTKVGYFCFLAATDLTCEYS
jgi:hypothetical protein